MKRPTRAQQKAIVEQWKKAAQALQQARDEELRASGYESSTVEALLDIGAQTPFQERVPNGLVEMQRLFMKAARKQGLLPDAVHEEGGGYSTSGTGGGGDSPAAGPVAGTGSPQAGQRPAPHLRTVGDPAILDRPKVALFCSVKCPGQLILDTYDLAQRFRKEGVRVISPFHSPMEQECLRILLRSPHPAIWCLARGLYRQIPSTPVDCRPAVAEGRLVMVTPFPDTVRHITAQTATIRNRLVAEMASAIVVAHAAPGSKMETLCRDSLAAGKPVYTFDHPANAALLRAGAKPVNRLDLGVFRGAPLKAFLGEG